jgi:hypothetical protein
MPAVDTEAQFKFLLCCIKHSASGKVSGQRRRLTHSLSVIASSQKLPSNHAIVPQVNFDNVSQELGIVSKAAA